MEEILHHIGCINLVNNGVSCITTGAGFLPSTVSSMRLVYLPLFIYMSIGF